MNTAAISPSKERAKDQNDIEKYNIESFIENYVRKLSDLMVDEKKDVQQLFIKHKKVFSDKPGRLRGHEHVIRISADSPFVRRPYPIPLHLKSQTDKEIQKMEQMGIIQRSKSEYCSPTRVVHKNNGDVRVCLDARHLNKLVMGNNESPQQLEQVMLKANGVKYISTTDLVKGYWQIGLAKQSRKLTAFLYDERMYEYMVLAFGVKDSGPALIHALDKVLGPEITEFVSSYVDDLLIMSKTFEEHVGHIDRLFDKLIKCGLTLSLGKSRFFRDSIPFWDLF